MNLSAVHGIIFLWTELHCWSEMHRPEILSHHLSYSSSSLLGVTTLQTPTPLPHFYPLKEHPPCKDPAVAQSVYPFYCSPLPADGVLFSFGLPHSSELVLSERGQKKLKYISEIGKCRVFTFWCQNQFNDEGKDDMKKEEKTAKHKTIRLDQGRHQDRTA